MEVNELQREQDLIEGYINRFYERNENNYKPNVDGVIDVEKYLKSKYRICWVLKEAYEDTYEGGISFPKRLKQNDLLQHDVKGSPTWEPLVYTTYSLLNGFVSYSELIKRDISEIAPSFQQIAYMNVGKMSAETKSYDKDIAEKYEFWKPILHWQLKQYAPQIIIFGHTLVHFQKDLGISDDQWKLDVSAAYAVKDGVLYIDAYHPAQRTVGKDVYVQDIIDIVKANANALG